MLVYSIKFCCNISFFRMKFDGGFRVGRVRCYLEMANQLGSKVVLLASILILMTKYVIFGMKTATS